MFRIVVVSCAWIGVVVAGASALAADIGSAVGDLGNGYVRMTFEARDGVCGDGWNSISIDGSRYISGPHGDRWERDCDEGPVRVLLKVRDGEVVRIKTRVGGRWRSGHDEDLDLGVVPAADAAAFLLDVAWTSRREAAEDAILPAVLARDVVVWPRLLEIARAENRPSDVRQSAVFWLGQLAGDKVTEGLVALVDDDDEDLEVRETAVFVLSQREGRENMRRLVTIATTHPHPEIRKQALFWLAQWDDPEVIDIFEEILLGDGR